MPTELKFRSWEELFDFLKKVPADIRLRYISILLKRKISKQPHEKLEELRHKAQQELDALKLWKRSPAMQSTGVVEREEPIKRTALETAVAQSDVNIKKTGGIVEYTRAGDLAKSTTQMYGSKKFEENKEGVTYSQKSNIDYMAKPETEYTSRVSTSGTGSFKTSKESLEEIEKYKMKYKAK